MGTTVPSARAHHSAVWTGAEMIVWGGDLGDLSNAGPEFQHRAVTIRPRTAGSPITLTAAPSPRSSHTAVLDRTRDDRVGWRVPGHLGASPDDLEFRRALRSISDSWAPTSAVNVPSARVIHAAGGPDPRCWCSRVLPGHERRPVRSGDRFVESDRIDGRPCRLEFSVGILDGNRSHRLDWAMASLQRGVRQLVPDTRRTRDSGLERRLLRRLDGHRDDRVGRRFVGPTEHGGRFNPATNTWSRRRRAPRTQCSNEALRRSGPATR
jgi:hypothetical protein